MVKVNLKDKSDALEFIKEVQEKCKHKDVSNWILSDTNEWVRYCVDCNKIIERKEIK